MEGQKEGRKKGRERGPERPTSSASKASHFQKQSEAKIELIMNIAFFKTPFLFFYFVKHFKKSSFDFAPIEF